MTGLQVLDFQVAMLIGSLVVMTASRSARSKVRDLLILFVVQLLRFL